MAAYDSFPTGNGLAPLITSPSTVVRATTPSSAATATTPCSAATATTSLTAAAATIVASSVPATTPSLESGRRQRHHRGPGRHRYPALSTAPTSTRTSTSSPMAAGAVHPRRRQHRHGYQRGRDHPLQTRAVSTTLTVNDLSGTDVKRSLSTWRSDRLDTADGQSDGVTVDGIAGNDRSNRGWWQYDLGLGSRPECHRPAEATDDVLTVSGFDGDDTINAPTCRRASSSSSSTAGPATTSLAAASAPTPYSAATATTSASANGGDLRLDARRRQRHGRRRGRHRYVVFDGSNVSENIDISANGTGPSHRDIANIVMDLNARRSDRVQCPRRPAPSRSTI